LHQEVNFKDNELVVFVYVLVFKLVCSTLPEYHDINIKTSDTESLLVDFLSEALN